MLRSSFIHSQPGIAKAQLLSFTRLWSALLWIALASPSLATTYYLDPAHGIDAASGLSPDQAWQTFGRLYQQNLLPGDEVRLASGAVFQEMLYLDANHKGSAALPIRLVGDGPLPARIEAGDSHGVFVYNTGGLVFENLIVVGSGIGTNTGSGFNLYNDQPGRQPPITVKQVEASGFGEYGLFMWGWREDDQLAGFSGLTVTESVFHNNELAGLATWAHRALAITDVWVNNSVFHSNPGRSSYSNPSGNGIVLGRVDRGVIEHSVAYNNGASNTNSAGPVGIWAYDANAVVIQHNISHSNRSQGGDGGGFDLDGGVTNSIMQYNYSYNNDGAGYLIAQYRDAPPFGNNIVRYNISQNDGRRLGYGGITVWAAQSTNRVRDTEIYHNTVYITPSIHGTPAAVRLFGNNFTNINLRNNLLIADGASGVDVIRADVASALSNVLFQGNAYHHIHQAEPSIVYGANRYDDLESFRLATGQEQVNGEPVGLEVGPIFCVGHSLATPADPSDLPWLRAYRLSAESSLIHQGLDLVEAFGLDVGFYDVYGQPIGADNGPDVGASEWSETQCPPGLIFSDGFLNGP